MKNFKKLCLIIIVMVIVIFLLTMVSKATTKVKITGDTLNVRKGPSTNTSVIAMLFKGVECELLEEEENWYKIKYKTYTGYISKDYAEIIGESSNTVKNEENITSNANEEENTSNNEEKNNLTDEIEITYKKVNQNLNLKLLPLIYSNDIENIKKNTEVVLLGEICNWSYIQTNNNCGWIRTEYLENVEKTTSNNKNNSSGTTYIEKTAYISESLVNMRKGAGTNYSIIKVLALNTKLTIIDESGTWYKVKVGSTIGYVSKDYVSESKTTTTRGNSILRTENLVETSINRDKVNESIKESENILTAANDNEENTADEKEESIVTENKIKGTDIVAYAKKYLGYKYVYGGDGSNETFDCSGFTMYVYKHFGINIPHGANSQYKCGKGTKITKYSELQVGDIVMLTDYETGVGIGHCGIYIGNDNFIHASTTCNAVEISSFKTIYKNRFYAGLRLI